MTDDLWTAVQSTITLEVELRPRPRNVRPGGNAADRRRYRRWRDRNVVTMTNIRAESSADDGTFSLVGDVVNGGGGVQVSQGTHRAVRIARRIA